MPNLSDLLTKICSKCKKQKYLSDFHRNQNYCKNCQKEYRFKCQKVYEEMLLKKKCML